MSDEPTLCLTAEGVTYCVRFDRWDSLQSERARWHYTIRANHVRVEGDDLTTVGEPVLATAMETLLTFLSAAMEGRQYRLRTGSAGENEDLFPAELLDELECIDPDQVALLGDYVAGSDE